MSSSTTPRLPWQAVLAATVLATLAAVAVLVVLGDDDSPASQSTLELTPAEQAAGDTDPLELAVIGPEGDGWTLGDDLDGPTVVNFFASWCPPCIAEMPDFEAVFQDLDGEVDFLGLAVQDRTADATRIVEETGVTYRWARDARGDVASAAGVTQMPATMFVDADGTVISVHSGALDADELRELIADEFGVPTS